MTSTQSPETGLAPVDPARIREVLDGRWANVRRDAREHLPDILGVDDRCPRPAGSATDAASNERVHVEDVHVASASRLLRRVVARHDEGKARAERCRDDDVLAVEERAPLVQSESPGRAPVRPRHH